MRINRFGRLEPIRLARAIAQRLPIEHVIQYAVGILGKCYHDQLRSSRRTGYRHIERIAVIHGFIALRERSSTNQKARGATFC